MCGSADESLKTERNSKRKNPWYCTAPHKLDFYCPTYGVQYIYLSVLIRYELLYMINLS